MSRASGRKREQRSGASGTNGHTPLPSPGPWPTVVRLPSRLGTRRANVPVATAAGTPPAAAGTTAASAVTVAVVAPPRTREGPWHPPGAAVGAGRPNRRSLAPPWRRVCPVPVLAGPV
jgi:hypothetical protein